MLSNYNSDDYTSMVQSIRDFAARVTLHLRRIKPTVNKVLSLRDIYVKRSRSISPLKKRYYKLFISRSLLSFLFILSPGCGGKHWQKTTEKRFIQLSVLSDYIEKFNAGDDELVTTYISNSQAFDFLSTNIPRFECPDKQMEEIYFFRWWTYRKHIRNTPEGFIITEFLPDVPWAGKYNAISCPGMHQYNEGRWLHNQQYLNDYTYYWFRKGGSVRSYSFPVAYALYSQYLVSGNDLIVRDFLPDLIANFNAWEKERYDASCGLFWQIDDRDGMEVSICSSGYRATINSYMAAEAKAIATIAQMSGRSEARMFTEKSTQIQANMLKMLWDQEAEFFKVLSRKENSTLCDARELHGYTPWCFDLIEDAEYARAWKYLMDTSHFFAPYGPTTAEQCHPGFKISYEGHECQWNGPSWPFATSVTLTGLANLLNSQQQRFISKDDYFKLLQIYTQCHRLTKDDGTVVPWIDENINPFTGDWISRTRLKTWQNGTWSASKGGVERGKDYNHSTYCDLVISGLIGIRPQEGGMLVVNPLLPEGVWDYFCLENVMYQGKRITVLYDKTGTKYHQGKGLMIFVDGKRKTSSRNLSMLKCRL